MDDWARSACKELLGSRRPDGAWGYRKDRGVSAEATALACLGLGAQPRVEDSSRIVQAAVRGAEWLESIQGTDGSIGISPSVPSPGWPTTYALLAWQRLRLQRDAAQRAEDWLLGVKGTIIPRETLATVYLSHDSTLVGWPWVSGTHSWLEPTATAVIALRGQGLGRHPRVEEGVRLIRNRAIKQGGWNYGNKGVLGRELRPQPGPTGLALLALAEGDAAGRDQQIDRAIGYLREVLPEIRSPISLGWGVLGLRAWQEAPAEAGRWLEESYAHATGRCGMTAGLGLILLANGSSESTLPGTYSDDVAGLAAVATAERAVASARGIRR